MSVPAQELDQAEDVSLIRSTDDDWSGDPALEEPDATEDERAHDPLAQLGLRDEQVAEPRRRDDQRLDGADRLRVHQRRAARELRELAHERPRSVRDDRLISPERVVLRDRDLAGQD